MSCMQQYQIEMRSRIIQEVHKLLDHLPDDPKSTLLERWEGFYTIFRDSCEQLHAGPEVLHRGMDLYADVREYIRSNIYF